MTTETKSTTPRSTQLEAIRVQLGQERTPAYGDALRLSRSLETEVTRLTTALAAEAAGRLELERTSNLLAARVASLEGTLKDTSAWVTDCVNDVLYPLSHEATPMGATADGLGGASVAIIHNLTTALAIGSPT